MLNREQKIIKRHSFKRLNHVLTYYKWIKSATDSALQGQFLTLRRSMIKELLIMKQGQYYYFHICLPNDMSESINIAGADYQWLKKLGLIKVVYADSLDDFAFMPLDANDPGQKFIGCTLTKMGRKLVNELFPEYKGHYPKAKAGSMKDKALNEQINNNVRHTMSVVIDKIHQKNNAMKRKLYIYEHKVQKAHLPSKIKESLLKKQYARCSEYTLIQHLSELGLPDIVKQLKHTGLTPTARTIESAKLSGQKMHHLFYGKNAITKFKILSFLANHVWKTLSKDHYDYLYSATKHRMFYHTISLNHFPKLSDQIKQIKKV